MGCFRACFSFSKSRNRGKSAINTSLRDHIEKPAEAIHPAHFEPKSRDELEKGNAQELLATTAKKSVIFDLVTKDNASDLIQKSSAAIYSADKLENDTDQSIPFRQNVQQQDQSSGVDKVTLDPAIKADKAEPTVEIDDLLIAETDEEKSGGKKDEKGEEIEDAVQDLLVFKPLPYPANNRYGNCNASDEESEDWKFEENSFDEEGDWNNDRNEKVTIPSESSGSLFSLSIDFDRQGSVHENEEKVVNSAVQMIDFPDLEAMEMNRGNQNDQMSSAVQTIDFPDLETMEMNRGNQNDQMSSHCVDSVLNPVENLTRWKPAKEKTTRPFGHHQEKENISLEGEYKSRERNSKHRIAVDTSLSSWLVESENTPKSKSSDNSIGNYSPLEKGWSGRSFEDRPILGALTMEDLKQFSASPSPIRSRSRSPVETPIIGTVGTYWIHTQEELKQLSAASSPVRSRSRSPVETPIMGTVGSYWRHEDLVSAREENTRRQKTPFVARLEKALEGELN